MVADFTKPEDWGVTPEDAVRSREKALSSTRAVQAAQQKSGQLERGGILDEVGQQAAKAAMGGRSTAIPGLVGAAMEKAAEKLPELAQKEDTLALMSGRQREDIIGGRQDRAVKNYVRDTELAKQKAADYIAKRAFDMDLDARQLAFHQNGYVIDKALSQTKSDFDAGRLNADQINQLKNQFTLDAARLKGDLDRMKAQLDGQLKLDLANKDLAAAKARIQRYMDALKKQMQAQAKANMFAGILSGAVGIAGGVAAGWATGGNPFAISAGFKAGSELGGGIGGNL